jgi:hypothetical protein
MFIKISGGALKVSWYNVTTQDFSATTGYFSGMSCAKVNQTVFNYYSSIKKGDKVEIPTFDFNLAEYNISVKFYNLTRDSGSSCNFMIPVTLVN